MLRDMPQIHKPDHVSRDLAYYIPEPLVDSWRSAGNSTTPFICLKGERGEQI